MQWDAAKLGDLSLTGSTPCFEDLVLLGVVQLTFVTLLAYRAVALKRDGIHLDVKLRGSRTVHVLRLLCCTVLAVVPLLVLNVNLAQSQYATYELISDPLSVAVWVFAALVVVAEDRYYARRGGWISRFLYIFAAVSVWCAVTLPRGIMMIV